MLKIVSAVAEVAPLVVAGKYVMGKPGLTSVDHAVRSQKQTQRNWRRGAGAVAGTQEAHRGADTQHASVGCCNRRFSGRWYSPRVRFG